MKVRSYHELVADARDIAILMRWYRTATQLDDTAREAMKQCFVDLLMKTAVLSDYARQEFGLGQAPLALVQFADDFRRCLQYGYFAGVESAEHDLQKAESLFKEIEAYRPEQPIDHTSEEIPPGFKSHNGRLYEIPVGGNANERLQRLVGTYTELANCGPVDFGKLLGKSHSTISECPFYKTLARRRSLSAEQSAEVQAIAFEAIEGVRQQEEIVTELGQYPSSD